MALSNIERVGKATREQAKRQGFTTGGIRFRHRCTSLRIREGFVNGTPRDRRPTLPFPTGPCPVGRPRAGRRTRAHPVQSEMLQAGLRGGGRRAKSVSLWVTSEAGRDVRRKTAMRTLTLKGEVGSDGKLHLDMPRDIPLARWR